MNDHVIAQSTTDGRKPVHFPKDPKQPDTVTCGGCGVTVSAFQLVSVMYGEDAHAPVAKAWLQHRSSVGAPKIHTGHAGAYMTDGSPTPFTRDNSGKRSHHRPKGPVAA